MATRNLFRTRIGAALALVLGLIGAPASAALVSSDFDPPDFFGHATFDVADACFLSDGFHSNGGPCTITWLTATVTFREGSGLNRMTTFNYSNVLPDPNAVTDIFIAGGQLTGVNSMVIGPRVISGDPVASFNGPWWIQYNFTPNGDAPSSDSGQFGFGTVSLFGGSCPEGCFRDPNVRETADVIRFSRVVPEPGTLGLLLAPLALGWFARRRKSAKA